MIFKIAFLKELITSKSINKLDNNEYEYEYEYEFTIFARAIFKSDFPKDTDIVGLLARGDIPTRQKHAY